MENHKSCHNHAHADDESEKFLQKLKDAGCRITGQRKALVTEILTFSIPFSAEELHKGLKEKGIDLATVYRSLSTFHELGLLSSVDFSDGTLRYEYNCSEDHHHHHIICRKCKAIEPIHICIADEHQLEIENLGYTQVSHKLEFFGLCKNCN
jgi:Fur family ferric uptake transcriptional regulator